MNCGRVSNLLSAFADRELTGADMLQIRRHLNDCGECQAEYEALCRMKLMLGRLRAPAPPPDLVAQTVRRFETASLSGDEPDTSKFRPAHKLTRLPDGRWLSFQIGLLERIEGFRSALTLSPPVRLKVGLLAAALATALVVGGIGLLKPRHSDALVATIPSSVLLGQESQDSSTPLEGRFVHLPPTSSTWGPLSQETLPLQWVPVSLQRTEVGR
jgi:anti-sigma factor RsiW